MPLLPPAASPVVCPALGQATAASTRATAAMGIAVALAHYRLAVGVTILLTCVLRGLVRFDGEDS